MEAVRAHPRLRLLADLSHYSVVCEAPCGDALLEAAIAELLPRVGHVHARVGHTQGPQVTHPRLAPEQAAGHAAWWRGAWAAARARGDAEVTVSPEFLPAPYCPVDAAGQPVVDVGDVNAWVVAWVRREWAALEGGAKVESAGGGP